MRKFLLAVALTLPAVSMAYEKVDKEAFFDAGVFTSCINNKLLSRSDGRSIFEVLGKNKQLEDFANYNSSIATKRRFIQKYGEEGIIEINSSFSEGKRYGTNIDQCYNLWAKYTSTHT